MIQATFTVSGSDFNDQIFEQIKKFIIGNGQEVEVFIKMKPKETKAQMRQRIEKAMDDTEKGVNLISFTGEEYTDLIKNLSNK